METTKSHDSSSHALALPFEFFTVYTKMTDLADLAK